MGHGGNVSSHLACISLPWCLLWLNELRNSGVEALYMPGGVYQFLFSLSKSCAPFYVIMFFVCNRFLWKPMGVSTKDSVLVILKWFLIVILFITVTSMASGGMASTVVAKSYEMQVFTLKEEITTMLISYAMMSLCVSLQLTTIDQCIGKNNKLFWVNIIPLIATLCLVWVAAILGHWGIHVSDTEGNRRMLFANGHPMVEFIGFSIGLFTNVLAYGAVFVAGRICDL